jgi:hypothetical protein
MKKMVLGLSLALVTLGFLVSPAMAADPPQAPRMSVADQAFLASLATPVGTPAPVLAAKSPRAGLEKALCTATVSCLDGTSVSCQGNNSTTSCKAVDRNCSVGQRGSVTCDGVTTSCPACPCSLDCTAARRECVLFCDPCGVFFTCSLSTCTQNCRCRIC